MKVRLPVRLGGLGLSSLVDLSPVAFIGGLQQSLPHFIRDRRLCAQLQGILGGPSGELQPADSMWEPLLASGCRMGQELRESWAQLQGTGQQACQYLERELQGALSSPVQGVGVWERMSQYANTQSNSCRDSKAV